MTYKHILFDLDGTLTDPKVGITKSVAYAIKKMRGIDEDTNQLTKFIGPPLGESFQRYYDLSVEESKEAIEIFREYFKEKGIYENELYDGISELLSSLKEQGKRLYVATSKPTVFAEIILKHFNIDDYFTQIVGSNLDGSRSEKAKVIQEVLDQSDIDVQESIVMIGDRKHDVIGANYFNMDSIGVSYGYSELGELEKAGANYVVDSVKALSDLLLS